MKVSGFFVASTLLTSILIGACSGEPRPPDVLLVTVDTLRADFLGAYGFEAEVSPNVDALARRSVTFERAIAASARTAPSHASIMTSRWVREHTIGWANGWTRLTAQPTLAAAFQEAGYATAAFVGNVVLNKRIGLNSGFGLYDAAMPDMEASRPGMFERIAEKTTERAIEWLSQESSRPRFLWVHYQDPHGPYTPPPPYDHYRFGASGEDGELPPLELNQGQRGIPAYQVLGDLRRVSEYKSRYAGEIRYFDHWLGRLLEAFEAGPRDKIILLTSDHGESLGEDGWYFCHGFRTTPDQAWVPFLLHAPTLKPARRAELVHHVDVMPTLLDLAGVPVPEDARGIALGALLREEIPLPERVLFTDIGSEISAYQGASFFRARIPKGNSGRLLVQEHSWPARGGWGPGVPNTRMRKVIRDYAANPTQSVRATAPDPSTIERLRALGYIDPEVGSDPEAAP